jgi:hydrocephalus-inducing protein
MHFISIESESQSPQVGDLDKNPVYESIARYLGIDLSNEGRAARNRRGIAIIVHGAPLTGKTRAAKALANYYQCASLSIDEIVKEAIASGTSSAASRARQMCAELASKCASVQRALEGAADGGIAGAPGHTLNGTLSVEALAQHSASRKHSPLSSIFLNNKNRKFK